MRTRAIGAACVVIGVVGATTSCSMGLDRVPLPAPNAGSSTYPLSATFANALNLPTKAKVRLAGADIGEVESMTVRNYVALVTMEIDSDVKVPAGTKAELRSATPLGDVFVALTPPAGGTPGGLMMRAGDTIPMDSTKSAATIEELLSTASLLVNGGAVRNLTKVVNGLGAALGGKGENLGQFIDESTRLTQNLADRSDAIKKALTQTSDLAATVSARQDQIDQALEVSGPALGAIGDNTDRIVDLVGRLNRITMQLAKFPSVRGEKSRSMMADLNKLSAELNDASNAPGVSLARFNMLFGPLLKLTNATSAHVDIDLADIAVGYYADLHHPMDLGSRNPTREDFRNMVGSITYELIRLRDKAWGPPTPPPGAVPPPNLVGLNPGALTPAPVPPPADLTPPLDAPQTPGGPP
ncbi:MAG: MlaD family protein [Mycobacterium sp.]